MAGRLEAVAVWRIGPKRFPLVGSAAMRADREWEDRRVRESLPLRDGIGIAAAGWPGVCGNLACARRRAFRAHDWASSGWRSGWSASRACWPHGVRSNLVLPDLGIRDYRSAAMRADVGWQDRPARESLVGAKRKIVAAAGFVGRLASSAPIRGLVVSAGRCVRWGRLSVAVIHAWRVGEMG